MCRERGGARWHGFPRCRLRRLRRWEMKARTWAEVEERRNPFSGYLTFLLISGGLAFRLVWSRTW